MTYGSIVAILCALVISSFHIWRRKAKEEVTLVSGLLIQRSSKTFSNRK
ncbi:hypothetical protein ACV56Z_15090 [Staphylococcus aureus]